MKQYFATGLVVLWVLGALIYNAEATESGDAALRRQAQSFLNTVAEMFDKKDIEAVVQTVLPGATLRYANGVETTIEEWKASALKEFAGIATMKSRFTVEKVVLEGDTQVVTYREIHIYALSAEKGHKYRSDSRWSVTLEKTPQGPKATHFVEFVERVTRDGKPIKLKVTPNPL